MRSPKVEIFVEMCRTKLQSLVWGRHVGAQGAHTSSVCLCSKYKEIYGRILKSLHIVNLYRGMSKLKLKINVEVPQLLCIVVSVAIWLVLR